MEKLPLIIGVVTLLIFGGLGGAYWYTTSSYTRTAFLNLERGDVQVDSGRGFIPATDGMELSLNDKVRTGDGVASIVLYESVIVALDPDTEVMIADLAKDNVQVNHDQGSAWHKFTGLAGVASFSVKTPNTVATVRGTEFGTGMEAVLVAENTVEVTADGQTFMIQQGHKIVNESGEFVERPLTEQELAKIKERMRQTLDRLKKLRWDEVEKKPALYKSVKALYGLTDREVQDYLALADAGEIDLDEVQAKSPIQSQAVQKVRDLTEKIIEQQAALQALS